MIPSSKNTCFWDTKSAGQPGHRISHLQGNSQQGFWNPEDQGTAAAQQQQVADATHRKNQKQSPRKKKSFWRKLLRF